jgi:LCP family protein required for cell wall assembly
MQTPAHPALKRIGALFIICFFVAPTFFGCGNLDPMALPSATPPSFLTPSITPMQMLVATSTLTPTPTEIPAVCGGPRVMYVLLIGSDARENTYNVGLADVIRIARVDFVESDIRLLTFPRDLYVEIPGIESHGGITHGKLNQAFLYGNPGYGYYDGSGQGPGLLALTLEKNFDVHTDHYLAVNLQTFSKFIDTLGGIDIRLPSAIDGRAPGSRDPNRYFPAGNQHLNGYRAMLLARMRPNGDIQRIETQDLIINAIAVKLFSPAAILRLPELIKTFSDSIQTDIGPAQIRQLTCLANTLNTEQIETIKFPDELFKSGRVNDPVLGNTSILEADFAALKIHVHQFQYELFLNK